MGFDADKFKLTQYSDRTAEVPVPELKKFFGEDDKPIWVVKCIGSNEISIANEARDANKNVNEFIASMASDSAKEKVAAAKKLLGVPGDDVTGDVARRISMLVSGSVDPVCDQELAVRISTFHPTVFFRLTNRILSLMGEGLLGE